MIKRLQIYCQEMYPIIPRLFVAVVLFFEVYFLVILTNDGKNISIGIAEFVGALTIFMFLFCLRIADDFKDYETDLRLFPERALPSGRVKKSDLRTLGICLVVAMIGLNVIFMNNLLFFALLFGYGVLMSVWFFKKYEIQNSLPLALVTHNPVQIIMNIYIISFACFKYNIPLLTFNNILIMVTLYFPGLVWEISRKVRAPQDETAYVTYSKLFGFKKVTNIIMVIMLIDVFTTSALVFQLYPVSVITVILSYAWLFFKSRQFIKEPTRFKLVSVVEKYEYITELTVVILIALYLFQHNLI